MFYPPRREADDEEGMEDWDQEQLEKVIADKHAKEKTNATSIICKHFLDAVERKQYGWWVVSSTRTSAGLEAGASCILMAARFCHALRCGPAASHWYSAA